MKSESPLLWEWHDKIYFGAAHGMAGILYMLLQVRYSMAYQSKCRKRIIMANKLTFSINNPDPIKYHHFNKYQDYSNDDVPGRK